MLESMVNAFRAPDIRRRLLFVLGMLIVYRALGHVLLPGINPSAINGAGGNNGFFDLLSLFSGSDIRRLSIIGLGLNPYINATIIMQILQTTIPSLQALSREGEYGRNQITKYSRWLSVPLAALQAYGILALVNATSNPPGAIFTTPFAFERLETITQIIVLTAGSVLLMWLGELITEKGIGNGISFIIFAGIISRAPATFGFVLNNPNWLQLILFAVIAILVIWVIIFVNEGQRRIPIQYATRQRGNRIYQGTSTFLPLRVNMSGVIPIIFAISILLFPYQLATYFRSSSITWLAQISNWLADPNTGFLRQNGIPYITLYFILTLAFGFFYTFVVFRPKETADNLRKQGGFILGIRPGRPTEEYLSRVVLRITLAGAIFLAFVATLPFAIQIAFPSLNNLGLGLGGTSVLIVVSVVIETMKQLEAQLMMRSYEGFIK